MFCGGATPIDCLSCSVGIPSGFRVLCALLAVYTVVAFQTQIFVPLGATLQVALCDIHETVLRDVIRIVPVDKHTPHFH